MGDVHLHNGLELRLTALHSRIGELGRKSSRMKSMALVEQLGVIEELERQRQSLADELDRLIGDGPDYQETAKTGIETRVDGLYGFASGERPTLRSP